jgi:hypothetical protein
VRPLLLIFTLALALAACGGDDFDARVDKATADLTRAYSVRPTEALDNGSDAESAARLQEQADLFQKAADELPTKGVPDVAKHALALTVDGLRKRAANRREAARRARAHDIAGAAKVLEDYIHSAADRELQEGFDELAELG